jgi:hypothetical protein
MALFQSTVIEKYINAQDQKVLKEKWEAYLFKVKVIMFKTQIYERDIPNCL